MLGAFHTACGALALLLGVWIFLTEKGTRRHLRIGWAYVGSMACLNGSALVIYRLTGGFNMFHALAIFSLTTVGIGVAQVRWRYRPPNWLWRHYQYMSWSYVGLLAATCNEAFVRVPLLIGIVGSTTTRAAAHRFGGYRCGIRPDHFRGAAADLGKPAAGGCPLNGGMLPNPSRVLRCDHWRGRRIKTWFGDRGKPDVLWVVYIDISPVEALPPHFKPLTVERIGSQMRAIYTISAAAVFLVAPGPCFADWGSATLSRGRAKELRIEVRSKAAGPQQVHVEMEFKPEGELKGVGRVDLRVGGDSPVLTAPLEVDRSKPGRLRISFTADPAILDKFALELWARKDHLGGTIYQLQMKDVVGAVKGR